MTTETILYAAVTALAGCVVHLYTRDQKERLSERIRAEAERAIDRVRIDKCETDRTILHDVMTKQSNRIATLEAGCGAPQCPLRQENG